MGGGLTAAAILLLLAVGSSHGQELQDHEEDRRRLNITQQQYNAALQALRSGQLASIIGPVRPSEFPACFDGASRACYKIRINETVLFKSNTFKQFFLSFKRKLAEGRTMMFEVRL